MCGTLLCTAIIGSEYIRLASHVPGSVVHVVMWHTGLYLALYCPSQCMCRCMYACVMCTQIWLSAFHHKYSYCTKICLYMDCK